MAGDASTRRFYRVAITASSAVLVDAPPDSNPNNDQFVRLSSHFRGLNLHVPEILAANPEEGFFLVEDLGDNPYLRALGKNPGDVETLYGEAFDVLVCLFTESRIARGPIPDYTRVRFHQELQLFADWFVGGLLNQDMPSFWPRIRETLLAAMEEQPCVCVHRDFHSRNLLVMAAGETGPGIVDYQDALWGPLTYDLVSLTRDCYIAWPESLVHGWHEQYRMRLASAGLACDKEVFHRWCDLTATQRHLKAVGIFARLYLDAHRDEWLADIPRTLDYLAAAGRGRPVLADLGGWIDTSLRPAFVAWQARHGPFGRDRSP